MSLGQANLGHTYRGRLAVEADSNDLIVDLRICAGTVEVLASTESLGVWSISHVSVSRHEDGRFILQLGDEEAFFRAEDPLVFAYEATATIKQEQARFRNRLRAYWPSSGEPRRTGPDADGNGEAASNGADPVQLKVSEPPRAPSPRHLRGAELGA